MKGSRQKSPGTVIRVDAMDEPNTNLITAEQDEFVPIYSPTWLECVYEGNIP